MISAETLFFLLSLVGGVWMGKQRRQPDYLILCGCTVFSFLFLLTAAARTFVPLAG